MIILHNLFPKLLTGFLIFILLMAGCSPALASTNQQIDAIQEIRQQLGLPDLPLDFSEKANMLNSPGGDVEVAIYQDQDGRKYSMNPQTNQVLEIDARAALSMIAPDAQTLSVEELKTRAAGYARTAIPDFDELQSNWRYEEGMKGDYHFFNWYGEMATGAINRPMIQIGLHRSGSLFAYINTSSLR